MNPNDRIHAAEGDIGQRTDFQRDRDALLYSSAFRRLAGVTQVYSPNEGQLYHNRLTHTLEVAQIARRIAEYLVSPEITDPDLLQQLAKQKKLGVLDPEVAETAALAHDLGHPPFGHVAEHTLNKLLQEDGGEGFEGNAQSFRVVNKLTIRQDESDGLNLTRASLNAILKYPWMQKIVKKKPKETKWGAYETEEYEFKFAREGSKKNVRSLNAQVMDWADDIAYSIHDTEDFYRAGLIPLGQLSVSEEEANNFVDDVFAKWEQKETDFEFEPDYIRAEFLQFVAEMPFKGPFVPDRKNRQTVRSFTSKMIGYLVQASKIQEEPDEDGNHLVVDEKQRVLVKMLKQLTWEYVIYGPTLAAIQGGQKKIIREIYDALMDSAQNSITFEIFPQSSRWQLLQLKKDHGRNIPDKHIRRTVADTISLMTDYQATMFFKRIAGDHVNAPFETFG